MATNKRPRTLHHPLPPRPRWPAAVVVAGKHRKLSLCRIKPWDRERETYQKMIAGPETRWSIKLSLFHAQSSAVVAQSRRQQAWTSGSEINTAKGLLNALISLGGYEWRRWWVVPAKRWARVEDGGGFSAVSSAGHRSKTRQRRGLRLRQQQLTEGWSPDG